MLRHLPLTNFFTLPFVVYCYFYTFICLYATILSLTFLFFFSLLSFFLLFFWHVIALVRCSLSFSKFQKVVEDYDQFDVGTKGAILKASSSVVSLISRIGDSVVYIGSGTIIECDAFEGSYFGTILTCATLLQGCAGAASIPPNLKIDVYLSGGKFYEGQVLTYDLYYNIATIKIKSNTPLTTASIRYIDDSISIETKKSLVAGSNVLLHEDEEVASTRFNLCPGELVISLARYCEESYEIMAAPGLFSCDDCSDDCKELFSTTCTVNLAAVGGPLVNCYGEVIGVNFIIRPFSVFLPINIALKCLEDLKNNRQVPRPWLGVGISNLYTAKLEKLEELTRNFPHVVKGVIVEQIFDKRMHSSLRRGKVFHCTFWSARKWLKAKNIIKNIRKKNRRKARVRKIKANQKSSSRFSGLCVDDVIIGCDGKSVGSHLELVEALWNKEGKPVELVVVRPSIGQKHLTVAIGTSPEMNRWHILSAGVLSTMQDRLAIERSRRMNDSEMEQ